MIKIILICNRNIIILRYGDINLLKIFKMNKTLTVIEPFLYFEPGDVFERTEDGNYAYEENEYNTVTNREDGEMKTSFSSKFVISAKYAEELIKSGILEDPFATKNTEPFVNVFDEIDDMLITYSNELKNIDKDMKDQPACLKVEKTTVLNNMIKILNHLKGLKR